MPVSSIFFRGHLDDDEEILDVIHRHWFLLMKASYRALVFGFFPPIIAYIFFPAAWQFLLIWGVVGVCFVFYHFVDWFFDAWLLTNTGVIDVEKNGLFDRNSTRVEYHMIEGIAYSVSGFWATILGFGDITIDKIGVSTSVKLLDGPSPKKIERLVIRYQDKYVSERSVRDHNALKDMLSEMIAYHISNNKIKPPKR